MRKLWERKMIGRIGKRLIQAVIGLSMMAGGVALAQQAPEVGVVDGTDRELYCAFLPEGQQLVFDDRSTWRFVYITDLSMDGHGYMMLDGVEREIWLTRKFHRSDFEMRHYRVDDAPYEIKVFMVPGESGLESTAYSGAIWVTNGEVATAVAFHGDCGV